MTALAIKAYTASSCLGLGRAAQRDALLHSRTGLRGCDFPGAESLSAWIGRVNGLEQVRLPADLQSFDCRNNRLAELSLQQDGFAQAVEAAVARHGAGRVGVFMGTSTSGIGQTEQAFKECSEQQAGQLPDWFVYEGTHNTYSVAAYVRARFGLTGHALTISTACSSSAKVFANAQRALQAGLCDAAVVGGVDSLCLTTLFGFNALQLVSAEICRPADQHRDGISIGEAGGFALVELAGADTNQPQILACGESSDAYHMSSPEPNGAGAQQAMQQALQRAGLEADQIDYINLHGTATPANDLAEGRAVAALFGQRVPSSSTKGWSGHTLGAAGILETVFCLEMMQAGHIPQSLNTVQVDEALPNQVLLEPRQQPVRYVISNSFGFGGSNCALVLGVAA